MVDYARTGGELPTFVSHLECSLTGERYPADTLQTLSKAGQPLLVRYDLDGVSRALPREALATRPQTLWRYRELLPMRRPENVVSLGEVVTPLIPLPRIAARLARGGEILSFAGDITREEIGTVSADWVQTEGGYRGGKIWYARLGTGDQMVPVRMEFDTEFGKVEGYLAEMRGGGVDLHFMD